MLKTCQTLLNTSNRFITPGGFKFLQHKLEKVLPGPRISPIRNVCQSTSQKISNLSLSEDSKVLWIDWNGSSRTGFPAVFLRDNCQCSKCFLASSKSRSFLMRDLDLGVFIKDVTVLDGQVQITWSDDHSCLFPVDYLEERSFSEEKYENRKRLFTRSDITSWNSNYSDEIRRHNFTKIVTDDSSLLRWLLDLEQYGLTIVEEMGRDVKALRQLTGRIGFIRATHYGVEFEVKTKSNANNVAYTPNALDLHLDLPYYSYMPGTQFLHCIDQVRGVGGENEFVDGFHVAKTIREQFPHHYPILTKAKLDFADLGSEEGFGEFKKMLRAPVFSLDDEGQVTTVRYSSQVRDSHMVGPVEHVIKVYESLKLFDELAHHPENMIVYKLEEGECVVFDNHRVLHSRRGFELKPGETRWLRGAYVDWDEIRSRINVLRSKQ